MVNAKLMKIMCNNAFVLMAIMIIVVAKLIAPFLAHTAKMDSVSVKVASATLVIV